MNVLQLLKSLLLLALISGVLMANEDEEQSKCEKKYDKCIEKCDTKDSGTEECYKKCDDKNEKCVADEEK